MGEGETIGASYADAQVQATANLDVGDIPPLSRNDVDVIGEPADTRSKRRREPEDATADGGSVGAGRPFHGVEKAGARSESVGVGRPLQRVERPAPGVTVLVLTVLSRGLKRPTPGKKVLVLAALSGGLKGQRRWGTS
jgi:hypothetical protein